MAFPWLPPPLDGGNIPQTVTFRLADSLPQAILDRWQNELVTMPEARASVERRRRIEHYPDYYDRFIRDERHFVRALEYIEMNPVAAGLCLRPEDWPYGSARFRRSGSASSQPA